MAKPVFDHHWKLGELSSAMHLSQDQVLAFFRDGRRGGFLLEKIVIKHIGGKAAPPEAPYDAIDTTGGRWEVRSLTRASGIFFTPSNQRGSQREYNESPFLDKLAGIKGYYIGDLNQFPDVPFYRLLSDQVIAWHRAGQLSNGSMSYATAKLLFAG